MPANNKLLLQRLARILNRRASWMYESLLRRSAQKGSRGRQARDEKERGRIHLRAKPLLRQALCRGSVRGTIAPSEEAARYAPEDRQQRQEVAGSRPPREASGHAFAATPVP